MPKASTEANKLWPHLIQKVQRVAVNAVATSSGSAGVDGAPSPHALDSVHHSGTLSNTQGPQFLLVDGTRTLTGNLAVDPGISIDGVDLSAHVADPDAHHTRASAGNTGISVTGQAISLALATTSGLAISSGLKVGAGDGIDVLTATIAVDVTDIIDTAYGLTESSNDIRIDLEPTRGLEFVGGDLAMGTPTSLSVSTTNSFSGVGHAHAVTASSDVGTTPAASLLKSTGSGGLILGTLTVKGSVDVINGGDFTVGTNILFVDASLESIGVNRAPDPQFDLDVAGNLRAAYIVGKHAIQLEDALLIAHYDNREPHGSNHYGELNGHMGQVANPQGGVALLPGKFYGALSIGEAATNEVTNPRFDVDLTGWSTVAGGGSVARSTEEFYIGQASAKMVYGTSQTQLRHNASLSVANGATVTISAWVYRKYGTGTVALTLRNGTDSTNEVNTNCSTYGEWEFLQIVHTNSSGVSKNYTPWVRITSSDTAYVSGVMMVAGLPVPYVDGAMGGYDSSGKPDGSGYTWSGTAHASSSSRVAASLAYAASGNVGNLRGTIMLWAKVPWGNYASSRGGSYLFSVGTTTGVGLRKVASSTQLRVQIASSDVITYNWAGWDDDWHHFAVTWDGVADESNLYIDGALVAQGTASELTVGDIYVGSYSSSSSRLGGYIDDFVITSRVQTAGRIRSIYESDAPVFAESSIFHFRATPKGLVFANDEGLWMRDADGDTVMGFYGGEAATKSWGGFTLEQGDIAFGRYGASDGGWFWFDRDGVSSAPYLRLGYSDKTVIAFDANGASLDGVLEISTGGGLWQGDGSFSTPGTGLKIWNESGYGRIAGFNSSTEQWFADTDGKLYAGAGAVVLDEDGIALALDATAPIRFVDGSGVTVGSLQHKALSTPTRYELQLSIGNATRDGVVYIEAADTGSATDVILTLDSTAGAYSGITTFGGNPMLFYANGGHVELGPSVYIGQLDSTGAQPVLQLEQYDVSEEFIQFNGTISTGQPIEAKGSKSLTTTHFIRVSLNGSFYYIPVGTIA